MKAILVRCSEKNEKQLEIVKNQLGCLDNSEAIRASIAIASEQLQKKEIGVLNLYIFPSAYLEVLSIARNQFSAPLGEREFLFNGNEPTGKIPSGEVETPTNDQEGRCY